MGPRSELAWGRRGSGDRGWRAKHFPGEGYGAKEGDAAARGSCLERWMPPPYAAGKSETVGVVRALNKRRTKAVSSGDQRVTGTRRSRYLIIVGGHSARA